MTTFRIDGPRGAKIDVEIRQMTEADFASALNMQAGYCVACGECCECCEPDTSWRRCESCGDHKVFGAEELLIRGLVEFVD